MLGRKNRFHGRTSVLPVYRQASVVRGDGCSLHIRPNPKRATYRLAVVVSKKVSKSAVQRNRIRRRIYEVVRTDVLIERPVDIIITVFDDGLATCPHDELEIKIKNLFQKSPVILR